MRYPVALAYSERTLNDRQRRRPRRYEGQQAANAAGGRFCNARIQARPSIYLPAALPVLYLFGCAVRHALRRQAGKRGPAAASTESRSGKSSDRYDVIPTETGIQMTHLGCSLQERIGGARIPRVMGCGLTRGYY